ncbi:hypothetical protein ENUP19_0113G0019 [Entamoeba nuttalli]|uniref:TLDc domain-containing protein n=2 Tax=Entamoeba nuttalli TaxID=412467 RepID=K2GQQ0_ENTNP|nr:hypothetical protein ENU1_203160 [Entamoeba nuttalli P19]EKE37278.1 hypothetical protein ENU1_203160 [Entamoeba nuttalli P19]|eukprot:XP_008860398.1 hypothetical protein ENU1_203160 [Entamoeba nuttalli P19]
MTNRIGESKHFILPKPQKVKDTDVTNPIPLITPVDIKNKYKSDSPQPIIKEMSSDNHLRGFDKKFILTEKSDNENVCSNTTAVSDENKQKLCEDCVNDKSGEKKLIQDENFHLETSSLNQSTSLINNSESNEFCFGSSESDDGSCEIVMDNQITVEGKQKEKKFQQISLSDFKEKDCGEGIGFELGYGMDSEDEIEGENNTLKALPKKCSEAHQTPVIQDDNVFKNKSQEEQKSSEFDFGSDNHESSNSCIFNESISRSESLGSVLNSCEIKEGIEFDSPIKNEEKTGKVVKLWQPSLSDFKEKVKEDKNSLVIGKKERLSDKIEDSNVVVAKPISIKSESYKSNKLEPRESFIVRTDKKTSSNIDSKTKEALEIQERLKLEQQQWLKKKEEEEKRVLEDQLNSLEITKEENLNKGIIKSFIPSLQQWTGMQKYDVIYNSKLDGFKKERINNHICLKKHVMVLVFTTDGNVFGCYNSKRLPAPSCEGFVMDDPQHFIFTLKNPLSIPPTKFVKKSIFGPSVGINFNGYKSVDGEDVLLTCRWFFYIREKDSSISSSFSSIYNDIIGKEYFVFTGTTVVKVERVIALEWKKDSI